eukprot:PhM_4_TR18064/c1_g1_i2/m.101905
MAASTSSLLERENTNNNSSNSNATESSLVLLSLRNNGEPLENDNDESSNDDDDHDNNNNSDDLIWDYSSVTVAFISFTLKPKRYGRNSQCSKGRNDNLSPSDEKVINPNPPPHTDEDSVHGDDDNTYERVAPLLDEMERTVLRHGVMKVKTTSTTMLLVAGADKAVGVSEGVRRMCHAVLDVVQWVLSPHVDCEYRAGIHCGACFGAVLGTKGLTFDVFGDTVNTASRVMSTAPSGSVHVSTVAVDCLGGSAHGAPEGTTLVGVDAVHMKGKGTMNVFRLEEQPLQYFSSD